MAEKIQLQDLKQHLNKDDPAVILNARDIWHSYDGQSHVLRGVNVELREGLFTMLLGRSASGKTTLIKILAHILTSTRGRIGFGPGGGAVPSVAYIPQNLGLVRNLSAWDNVMTGALGYTRILRSLIKKFDAGVEEKAQQIMRDLGIAAKASRKIWHLSGGERQRVAIARALMQNPRVILADEFVSQLDPVTSMEILGVMKTLTRDGIAFLVTTHDTAFARQYADRVIVMKDGRIRREYRTKDFLPEDLLEDIR